MSQGRRRMLIADDHALFRAGVRALLESNTDWEVGGEASTGDEALQRMRDEHWDAVLLDISMPDRTGIDILRQIRSHKPDLPILILSMYPEEQYAVNLLRAGATGYLTKDAVPDLVVTALRTLLAGRKYISDEVAQLLAKDLDGGGRPLHSRLSEREFQIFCKLAGGMTVGDIASELHLSNKTISTYRARVLEKMNLGTNADLTYYAIKNGLIQ